MAVDRTVKIGGAAGQGIQTVGQVVAAVCHRGGLRVMAINDFESRIRGGHSFMQVRIADKAVGAPCHQVDLLVALDGGTYDHHRAEMAPGALTLADAAAGIQGQGVLNLPFGDLARQAGGRILANTVAAGACLGLLGAPAALGHEVLARQFQDKGRDLVEQNRQAFDLGYQAAARFPYAGRIEGAWGGPVQGHLMEGTRALALGAAAADCRVAAFYPMSPATGILAQLAALGETFPLVVEQAEDEIAAANMVIGASFAGVRAMTATSGGGFCLMTEALGLAAITETPMVVVDAMRPGPATGLPTRTAQGDLNFVIHASQDEFPRFVLAPGTPVQAFEAMIRAFDLAERFQVPAIVLVDQYFNDSLFSTPDLGPAPAVTRPVAGDADLGDPGAYRRFAVSDDGVSPRALPCRGRALVVASSDEHREDGHISEKSVDRRRMVAKRFAKLPAMRDALRGPEVHYPDGETLLVGWGSTRGAMLEAAEQLRAEGRSAGVVHFTDLWPFPSQAAVRALEGRRLVMVEQNATGQLGRLLREQTGLKAVGRILKIDGRPFYPAEIVRGVDRSMAP